MLLLVMGLTCTLDGLLGVALLATSSALLFVFGLPVWATVEWVMWTIVGCWRCRTVLPTGVHPGHIAVTRAFRFEEVCHSIACIMISGLQDIRANRAPLAPNPPPPLTRAWFITVDTLCCFSLRPPVSPVLPSNDMARLCKGGVGGRKLHRLCSVNPPQSAPLPIRLEVAFLSRVVRVVGEPATMRVLKSHACNLLLSASYRLPACMHSCFWRFVTQCEYPNLDYFLPQCGR